MKTTKILYWSVTGLISASFFLSSYLYLSGNDELVKGFRQIGMPSYMLTLLGTAKLLGAIGIINPWFEKVREWSYAGFAFVLIGAVWVHIATSTPFVSALVFLLLLGTSYFLNSRYQRRQNKVLFSGI